MSDKNTMAYGMPKADRHHLLVHFLLPQLARRGGQSMEEMCSELGITREYYAQLESGEVPFETISPELECAIAKFTGMKLEMVQKLASAG